MGRRGRSDLDEEIDGASSVMREQVGGSPWPRLGESLAEEPVASALRGLGPSLCSVGVLPFIRSDQLLRRGYYGGLEFGLKELSTRSIPRLRILWKIL
ncbi:hypothetical protein KM043_002636 [Ampulex compressa]|nr:hypothetical protein KM043_002636 [Ampulex compressa]